MIVVVGQPYLRGHGVDAQAGGLAARVAIRAAAAGSRVELIAKIGDDPVGDELLLALARAGVGHVATLRDASRPTTRREAVADDDAVASDANDAGPSEDASTPDGGSTLEAADVALALRYLGDYSVVVAQPQAPEVLSEAIAAAAWAAAHLVVVLGPGTSPPTDIPDDALVLAVSDAEGQDIGELVGAYAAAVDAGEAPGTAFARLRDAADGA